MADKVTMGEFETKLTSGGYASAGGARKAVSRFNGWTDKAKTQARNLIDSFFGGDKPAVAAAVPVNRSGKKAGKLTAIEVPKDVLPQGQGFFFPSPKVMQAQQMIEMASSSCQTLERLQNMAFAGVCYGEWVNSLIAINNSALEMLKVEIPAVKLEEAPAPVEEAPARKPKVKAAPAVSKGNGEGTLEAAMEEDSLPVHVLGEVVAEV